MFVYFPFIGLLVALWSIDITLHFSEAHPEQPFNIFLPDVRPPCLFESDNNWNGKGVRSANINSPNYRCSNPICFPQGQLPRLPPAQYRDTPNAGGRAGAWAGVLRWGGTCACPLVQNNAWLLMAAIPPHGPPEQHARPRNGASVLARRMRTLPRAFPPSGKSERGACGGGNPATYLTPVPAR